MAERIQLTLSLTCPLSFFQLHHFLLRLLQKAAADFLSLTFALYQVLSMWQLHWRGADSGSVSSVAQLYPTLCDPMDCSTPGFPVHHQLLELTQTHVHWVGDVIQPSHSLSSPLPLAFSLSQYQGLFQWVTPSHQVAQVLELQLQYQSILEGHRLHLICGCLLPW